MKKFITFLAKKEQDRRLAVLKDDEHVIVPFKINAHRQTKECFPINSPKICQDLGEVVLDLNPKKQENASNSSKKSVTFKVNLSNPEYEISVDVREFGVFAFNTKFSSMGGMPVGTSRSVLCLLSGGFDSPVSSYLVTKRGCMVNFISFWSNPFIGIKLVDKIKQLVKLLSKFNSHCPTNLYLVPFANIQIAIRDSCSERFRTILYRRGMNFVANKVAKRYKMKALITGEALAQVASQTLPNLTCIEDSASYPVLRPCIAMDKQEILDISRKIGTHDISVIETPDCCTLFQPKKPVVQAKLADIKEEEKKILNYEQLINEAYKNVEIFQIKHGKSELVKLNATTTKAEVVQTIQKKEKKE